MTFEWEFEAECPHGATHQFYYAPADVVRAPIRCECDDLVEEAASLPPVKVSPLKLWWELRKLRRATPDDF